VQQNAGEKILSTPSPPLDVLPYIAIGWETACWLAKNHPHTPSRAQETGE